MINYKLILFLFLIIYFKHSNCNSTERHVANYSNGFVPNRGQFTKQENKNTEKILFKADLKNVTVWITRRGISYQFYQFINDTVKWNMMDMTLQGASVSFKNIVVTDSSEYYDNYILGNSSVYKIYKYKTLFFKNVYPGIDWKLFFDNNNLKQEFIVHPYADKKLIQLEYKAHGSINILDDEIILLNSLGKFNEGKLMCYEKKSNRKVKSNYKVVSADKTNFYERKLLEIETGDYDLNDTLIIDPILNWRTFLGGGNDDDAHVIHSDGTFTWVTGHTISVNFPNANPGSPAYFQGAFGGGFGDVFLSKFSSNGNLIWSTYYGGSNNEEATCLYSNGFFVYLGGYTSSNDFPLLDMGGGAFYQNTLGGGLDGFISRFDVVNGELQWSTFIGDTATDYISSLAIVNNNLYVCGTSNSGNNFPLLNNGSYFQTYAGGNDGFIMHFNSAGILQWSTYFGGTNNDLIHSISANINSVYIAGHTNSVNLPLQNPGIGNYFQNNLSGLYDGFIAEFNLLGNLYWSTYYGGSDFDKINSISLDNNYLWVAGITSSNNLTLVNPLTGNFYQSNNAGFTDGFISKYSLNNNALVWSSYYGGNLDDIITAIHSDGNSIWLSGYTNSGNIFTLNPGGGAFYQNNNAGFYDGFIIKFDTLAQCTWATYMGSSSNDYINFIHCDGNKMRICGHTQSFNLPAANPGGGAFIQANNAGSLDAFLMAFKNCINPSVSASYNSPLCVGDTLQLTVNTIPNASYQWFGPDFFYSTIANPTINNVTVVNSGNYSVIANVPNGCGAGSFVNVSIYSANPVNISYNNPVCENDTLWLMADNANNYLWQGPMGFTATSQNTFISNAQLVNSGQYTLHYVDSNGCNNDTLLNVIINQLPDVAVSSNSPVCTGDSLILQASGANNYLWQGPNGFTANTAYTGVANVTITDSGTYIVYGTDLNGCEDSSYINVVIDNCSFINESEDNYIIINPNPAYNYLNIFINNLSTVYNLKIYNVQGKIMYIDNIQNYKTVLLDNFPAGFYFLSIENDNDILYKNKIMVIK